MEVAELTQYVPFSRLQYCPAEISRESHLAVAGDNHLVILQSSGKHLDSREAHTAPTEVSSVVLGFGEDAGRPTVVSWIDASVLCVGFQSGLLSCLDVNGEELFIFQGSTSAVQSVKISNEKEGLKIWCLYEEGLLVSILYKHACSKKFDEAVGFKLPAQSATDDFVLYVKRAGHGVSLFDDDNNKEQIRAMVVGSNCAVAMYDLVANPSTAVDDAQRNKDKGSSISRSIYSMFWSDTRKSAEEQHIWSKSKMYRAGVVSTLEDEKRRVFRVTQDPQGCLAATADSLGRVLLHDLRSETAIRIWKGLRDARLGWVLDGDDTLLAIYAPLLGLVSLYKMCHGPCQRVIAVGLQLSLATMSSLRVGTSSQSKEPKRTENRILKFNADKNILDTIFIEAGVFSDSELEQVAQFVKDHQDNDENSLANSWKESLRSSDMHASIQEVMEREQRLRKSALHSGKELRRLLTDWNALSVSADSTPLERAILNILSRPMSLQTFVSMAAAIEAAELTGSVLDFTVLSNDDLCVLAPRSQWTLRGTSPAHPTGHNFSLGFYESLHGLLSQVLERESDGNDLQAKAQEELVARTALLSAYKQLREVYSGENAMAEHKDGSANLTTMQRDEATLICKQNTFRAEALCWTLRSIKKLNPAVDAKLAKTPPPSQPTAAVSPIVKQSPSSAPNSLSPKRVSRVVSTTSRGSVDAAIPLNLNNSLSPVVSAVSATVATTPIAMLGAAHEPHVSFSAFRICFEYRASVPHLRREELRLAMQSSEGFVLQDVQNMISLALGTSAGEASPISVPTVSMASETFSLLVTSAQCCFILDLLFRTLFGDLVSLRTFVNALKIIDLHSAVALRDVLSLFVQYLCKQSLQTLVADILTRKMSVSPLQRWVRDHLLTFQDSYSSYLASVQKKAADHSKGQGEDSLGAETEPATRKASESVTEEHLALCRLESTILEDLVAHPVDSSTPVHPSFDQCCRYLFRAAWLQCRDESNLEAVQALAAILLETFYSVNDQVERRTYGSDNLKKTIYSWENLIRQVRVLLFIKNRIYDHRNYDVLASSVANLSDGKLSIFRILAMDTLVFAFRAEQAKEHEIQCLEVYKRRIQQDQAAPSASLSTDSTLPPPPASPTANSPPPPLPLPPVGNGAGSGKAASSAAASQGDVLLAWGKVADKRWRDIITIAMNEDAQDRLGTQDGAQRRRRKPLLLYFPDHNNLDLLGAYRSILLAEKWVDRIDKMEMLALVCEHLFELSAAWRPVLALHIYTQYILPAIQLLVDLEEEKMLLIPNERRKQLLNVMGEIALINAFVRSTVEILGFALEGRQESASALQVTISFNLSQFKRYLRRNSFRDEVSQKIWPLPADFELCQLFVSFHRDYVLEDGNTVAGSLRTAGYSTIVDENAMEQWTIEALEFQKVLLSVLQLRFQCGLRGVKPSQILGRVVQELTSLNCPTSARKDGKAMDWKQIRHHGLHDKTIVQARFEFIEQSFRRLTATLGQTTSVFDLSQQWGFSKDLTRLLVMKALVEQTGPVASRDEELEHMIMQFDQRNLVVDALISIVRYRLGGLVISLERHAATHGALLASLDSEAVAWVKLAIATHKSCSVASIAFKSEDLSSSRHLIISVQSLLIAVPVHLRKEDVVEGEAVTGGKEGAPPSELRTRIEQNLGLSHCASWLERKTRCDALLGLCNTLLQALQAAAAAFARSKK